MRWVTAGHEIESKVEHSIGLGSFLTRWVTRLKVRLDCHYLFAQFQPHVSQFCDLVMCQDLDSLRMSPGRYSAKCHFWFLWPSMTSLMNIPEWSVIICKICCYFFLVLLCFSLPQVRPTGKMYDVVGARLTSSEEWLWKDLVANRCRGGRPAPTQGLLQRHVARTGMGVGWVRNNSSSKCTRNGFLLAHIFLREL